MVVSRKVWGESLTNVSKYPFEVTQKFENEKKPTFTKYPSVDGNDIYIHWLPKEDNMYSTTTADPMVMFDNQANIKGTLLLEPTGLTGWGTMNIEFAKLESNLFKYQDETIDSDTIKFDVYTSERTDYTFKTNNISTHIDFVKRNAQMRANQEATKVDLPQNQYVGYIQDFEWKIDEEIISINSEKLVHVIEQGVEKVIPLEQRGGIPIGSHFISMHPEQDSLNFIAPDADYNLQEYVLFAHKVRYIKTADATAFPGDGEVTVAPKAKMRTLVNARLIANNDFKYHTFYKTQINIRGAKEYSGSGNYDYIDMNERKQVLYFDLIAVDDSMNTFAQGKITEMANFNLSPYFDYFGDVKLFAKNRNLTFYGQARIRHDCDQVPEHWVQFTEEINPDEIYIPVSSKSIDQNRNDLYSGVMMNTDSTHIFSTFLSQRKRYSDKYIVTAEGYVYFDKPSNKYLISSKEKIKNRELTGNFLSLHRTFCNLYGEGKIDLKAKLGQLKTFTIGSVNHEMNKDQTTVDVIMALDFFIDEPTLQIMADTFANAPQLPAVNMKRQLYTKGLAELVGQKTADVLIRETSLFGNYKKFPDVLNHSILITDLKLRWNSETNSYRSIGKIGIGNVMKTQVNKMFNGYLEIEKTRTGDAFGLYLEIDKANWYFFYYKRGLMQVYSSNSNWNNIIHEMKTSKRKMEVPKGEESYLYFLSNMRKKNEFIRRFIEDEDDGDDYDQYENY